eukprot:COSAG01_NODE_193_length_22433_cov_91.669114_2_plen_315_part_00
MWARALTDVDAVELAREDMQWAVEADYRLGSELRKALHERRRAARRKRREEVMLPTSPGPPATLDTLWSPSLAPRQSPTLRPQGRRQAVMPPLSLDGDGTPDSLLPSPHGSTEGTDGSGDMASRSGHGNGGDPTFALTAAPHSESVTAQERLRQYKAGIVEMVQEYFQAQEVGEVAVRLSELMSLCNATNNQRRGFLGDSRDSTKEESLGAVFVKRTLTLSMDFTAREFELSAVLLAALTPGMLSTADHAAGFSTIMLQLDDLSLDVPTAPALLSLFLARATLDDCLESSFLPQMRAELLADQGLPSATAYEEC